MASDPQPQLERLPIPRVSFAEAGPTPLGARLLALAGLLEIRARYVKVTYWRDGTDMPLSTFEFADPWKVLHVRTNAPRQATHLTIEVSDG